MKPHHKLRWRSQPNALSDTDKLRETTSANLHSLCIAATGGSSGKTLLSLGLGRALAKRNFIVQPFKKGPDYIDAAWLSAACRNTATNLDPYFQDATGLKQTFLAALDRSTRSGKNQFALVEGNRGLYDGLDANGSCSTSTLARALDLPILLCINAAKTSRTIAALIQGLLNFESGLKFCGLVLNNIGSTRHEKALRDIISAHINLPLLGILPRLKHNPIPERHMGLHAPGGDNAQEANIIFENLANLISLNCDIDKIINLTTVRKVSLHETRSQKHKTYTITVQSESERPVIGYVRDAALWFYYPENLDALSRAGAQLVELSLLEPWKPEKWRNIDALYLGGGFPEDYAKELSEAPALKFIIERAIEEMPIYAECGGMAILCRELHLEDSCWPMAGLFPASLRLHKAPQGLGYVLGQISAPNPFFPTGHILKGHEFHYTICETLDENAETALELERGQGILPGKNTIDALIYKNVWASYTHIFAPAQTGWAHTFAALARKWRNQRYAQAHE